METDPAQDLYAPGLGPSVLVAGRELTLALVIWAPTTDTCYPTLSQRLPEDVAWTVS